MSDYLEYFSISEHNFHISLLNIPEALAFFSKFDQTAQDMMEHLNALPDLTAQDAFFFITTFFHISLRQMRNAFYLILRRMSYDGLLISRVGLESAVFAYRIFKDPQLLEVWARKDENWKEFSQKFRREEFPQDMPFGKEIRKQLDSLNDYWAHPNINYFSQSHVFEEKEIRVHYFDHNDRTFHLVLLSFLDSCLKILTVFRKILEMKFSVFITSTDHDYRQLRQEFEHLKQKYRGKAIGRSKT